MGLELAISVAVGLGMGWWLDKYFDTNPWLTLLFLILGFVAGLRGVIRSARESMKDDGESNE